MRCPFSVFLCPFCFDEWHRIRSAIITKVLEFQPLWPIRILKWGSLAIFKLAYIWFMCGWKVLHIHFVYGWKIIHIHLLSRLWMTLVWEEIFHATNGKAQACTQGALLSFLLSLGGKWFLLFSLGSQRVHTIHAMKTPKWKTWLWISGFAIGLNT